MARSRWHSASSCAIRFWCSACCRRAASTDLRSYSRSWPRTSSSFWSMRTSYSNDPACFCADSSLAVASASLSPVAAADSLSSPISASLTSAALQRLLFSAASFAIFLFASSSFSWSSRTFFFLEDISLAASTMICSRSSLATTSRSMQGIDVALHLVDVGSTKTVGAHWQVRQESCETVVRTQEKCGARHRTCSRGVRSIDSTCEYYSRRKEGGKKVNTFWC
uniref:Uncharacterized protein n=1 Tax=Zea mays TaxID=4577 RepID=C4JBN9_MAIZE|nr:unknown [Zea mays]